MGVKPDYWIVQMVGEHQMIDPFEESQVGQGTISYGVSSYGYDMRLDRKFLVYRGGAGLVDPKRTGEMPFDEIEGDDCIIPAGSFVLARSLEYFRIPRSVLTICTGKSTYARCGLIVNVTPFEPEWEGFVTVSISNTSPSPVKVYAGEGIAQVVFLGADDLCHTSYADRKGKYQAQGEIVRAKVIGDEEKRDG